MKKSLLTLCVVLLLISTCFIFACQDKNAVTVDGDYVVIKVDLKDVKEGATLLDYMEYLKGEEKLEYVIKDGMITSINGKTGKSNQYWMLYTDDEKNSLGEWGSCVYNEKIYLSASLGAEMLEIQDGATYIWHLQTF